MVCHNTLEGSFPMPLEATPIDINHNPPTIQDLTEAVITTRQQVLIQRDGKTIAYLVPADLALKWQASSNTVRASGSKQYHTIASLAGAAGSLPMPLSWEEVREIAGEDQIREKLEREI